MRLREFIPLVTRLGSRVAADNPEVVVYAPEGPMAIKSVRVHPDKQTMIIELE